MKITAKQRHRARRFALQALYQQGFNQLGINELKAQFMAENSHVQTDWKFFNELTDGVLTNLNEINAGLDPFVQTGLKAVNPVELALLRLGAFELQYRIDIPYCVVLDEYIELAKKYGCQDGDGFVNGVLDQVAKTQRKLEYNAAKQ